MTIKQTTDVIQAALVSAYTEGAKSRRRVQIKTDQFGKFFLLETFVGNVGTDKCKHSLRVFVDGLETFPYWFKREDRIPLIAKMLHEGFKQKRIGEMLGLHASTIGSDVRYMRATTTLLLDLPTRHHTVKATARPAPEAGDWRQPAATRH